MILDFKKIFLIDAIGALCTASVIGLVFPQIISIIGLPIQIIYLLAAIALAYAAYSFYCYRMLRPAKCYLATIMIANLLYCLLTASIVVIHMDRMTNWGVLYFVAEILIILSLVMIEFKVYKKMSS